MGAQRRRIEVRGVVQGVGFRPFVYNLATALHLDGFVFNSSSGVTVEVEGPQAALDEFLQTLQHNPPPLAEIATVSVSDIEARGDAGFSILGSREQAGGFALIPPDSGTCEACWREFGDPANRRFGYPFTNCIHCGPRYTIIREVPMTALPRPCRPSPCAALARRNMTIPRTGAFMPNPMPALLAGRP